MPGSPQGLCSLFLTLVNAWWVPRAHHGGVRPFPRNPRMDPNLAAPSASNCLHSNPRFWPSWQSNGGASSAEPRPQRSILGSQKIRVPSWPLNASWNLRWTSAKPPTWPPWLRPSHASRPAPMASAPIAVPISPQPACTPHPRPRAACTARKRPSSTAGQPEQSFFSPLLYFKKAFS